MKKVKTKFGPWALITGASSGIDSEFAQQLAKSGGSGKPGTDKDRRQCLHPRTGTN